MTPQTLQQYLAINTSNLDYGNLFYSETLLLCLKQSQGVL